MPVFTQDALSPSTPAIPTLYQVTASPNEMVLGVGRDITFSCEESPPGQTSTHQETIGWRFAPSSETTPDPGLPEVVTPGGRFQLGEGSLTVTDLQVEDSGTYYCSAEHTLVNPVLTPISLQVEGQCLQLCLYAWKGMYF